MRQRLGSTPLVAALVLSSTAWLAASLAACSYFHDGFPGQSCVSAVDCIKGVEKCDAVTRQCVPSYDAGPTPDSPPVPDAPPVPDSGPDAEPADAGPDANGDAGDGGAPDAS